MKRWQLGIVSAFLVSVGVFAAPQVVTVCEGNSPVVAADSEGTIHMAYHGKKTGNHIFYRYSDDGGQNWSEGVNISNTENVSHYPSIAALGDRIAVAWLEDCKDHQGNDIYLVTSSDGGKTWSKAMDVSNTPGHSAHPVVAIGNGGSIHVAWSDTSEGKKRPDIYYTSSANGGESWTRPIDVSKTHGVYGPPAMVVDPIGGMVHIAWADYCSGSNHDIHVIHGMQDTWSKPRDISRTNYRSSHPSLALGGNHKVYASWLEDCTDHPGNDVWFAHSNEFGQFSPAFDLSRTPGHSSDPTVMADREGNVAVTWVDSTGHTQAPDVWYSRSETSGAKFTRPHNLTRTPGKSHEPHLVLVEGKPMVVWSEVYGGKSWVKVAPVKAKSE